MYCLSPRIDPLAAHFWGFRPRITNASIVIPIRMVVQLSLEYNLLSHHTISIWTWRLLARPRTRGPNYYGYHSENMDDLGLQMADDPRFFSV